MSFVLAVVVLLPVMTCWDLWADEGKSEGKRKSAVFFPVKLFCSSKQAVVLPFKGSIDELCVRVGQKVTKGDVLARYSLSLEDEMEVERRLFFPKVKDLEIRLAQADRDLLELNHIRSSLTNEEKAFSRQDTLEMDMRIEAQSRLKEGISDYLNMEKGLAKDELELLARLLGKPLRSGEALSKGLLTSPMGGYVVWIHPDLEEGAEFQKGGITFQVWVMDPLTARAEVFENEALQLVPGDRGKIVIESLREREFDAEISYISWVPFSSRIVEPSYYEVKMMVPNAELLLREGLMGHVTFPKTR
jgi:multidrug efflux pump subunit AcrA (membrane-fusion protein)